MAKGFKHGASGASLNFKVVGGTTEPSNPKGNIIWVNTDKKITGWDFSAEQPLKKSNNKNLCVYPYYHTTQTTNGLTFTDNKDGTITVNGTATDNANFRLQPTGFDRDYSILLPAGTYTISDAAGNSDGRCRVRVSYDNGSTWKLVGSCENGSETFTTVTDALIRMDIEIKSGKTMSGVVFKPQLEKGTVATTFIKGDSTGMVWFLNGTYSSAEFNALKKNGIQVYPISAKQYLSGAWVDKPTKIHQGDTWVGLTITILDGSDRYENITGGWKNENSWAYGAQNTVSWGTNGVTHSSQSTYSSMSVSRTTNKINLGGVSKIQATVDVSTAFEFMYLAVDSTFSTANKFVASKKFTADGVIELDVSGINEKCYIGVVFANGYDGRRAAKATLNKVVIS